MTSIPASRSARAMIFAPRSWPSRPGFAITTRIFRATRVSLVTLFSAVAPLDRAGASPRQEKDRERDDHDQTEERAGNREPEWAQPAVRRGRRRGVLRRTLRLVRGRGLHRPEHLLGRHRVDEPAPVARALQLDREGD